MQCSAWIVMPVKVRRHAGSGGDYGAPITGAHDRHIGDAVTRVIGARSGADSSRRVPIEDVYGGHIPNLNPLKQSYRCQTCGQPRPPYQFYCDKHVEVGEKSDKPLLVDRLMRKILGRS